MKEENAKWSLEQGSRYPYDAPSSWWNKMGSMSSEYPPKDWAHSVARGIVNDLRDRGGIGVGFSGVDDETRLEIVESIAEIIRVAAWYKP